MGIAGGMVVTLGEYYCCEKWGTSQDSKNSLSRGKTILSKISGQKNVAENWIRACYFQGNPVP